MSSHPALTAAATLRQRIHTAPLASIIRDLAAEWNCDPDDVRFDRAKVGGSYRPVVWHNGESRVLRQFSDGEYSIMEVK